MRPRQPPASRSQWRRVVVALSGPVLAVGALLAVACGGSEATPTAEATRTPDSSPTAALPTPSPAPTGIATVTVAVPPGEATQRLLLVEGATLALQELDGTRQQLADFEADGKPVAFPAWSPSGEMVAFVTRSFFRGDTAADFGDDVYLVPADGSGEPRLLREHSVKGEQVFGLTWRPDSQRLLIGRIDVELRNGIPTQIAGTAIVELDVATSDERTVIEGGYDPSLSADGERLAYLAIGELATESTLMVANGDGSDRVELARSFEFEVWRYPRISPNGRQIVITAAPRFERLSRRSWLGALLGPVLSPFLPTPAEAHGIPMDLWLIDVASGERMRLTAIGEDDPYPAWSADGQTLVFIGTNGRYEVSVAGDRFIRTGDGRFDGQLAVAPE